MPNLHLQRSLRLVFAAALVTTCVATDRSRAATQEEDRAAIAEAIETYVTAFNAKDAKTMAACWSPDGVYISRLSGEQVVGREAIATELDSTFAERAERQLAVATDAIEFVSPNVAVEHGTATVSVPDEAPAVTAYRAVFVKQNGQWLLDRVTEDETQSGSPNYEHLKELEWIIGQWVDQDGEVVIGIDCQWTSKKNHISRAYTVTENGQVQSSGLQIIGWDPKKKEIRSWLFDAEGGFVEGSWISKGDRWIVQSKATLSDGSSGSFTSVFRPIDDSSYGWQKINRVRAGEILPHLDEVIVTRQ